jgi:hypothetical protein
LEVLICWKPKEVAEAVVVLAAEVMVGLVLGLGLVEYLRGILIVVGLILELPIVLGLEAV